MAKADLTAQLLRAIVDYDAQTGVLTWRDRPQKNAKPWRWAGKQAGHIDRAGYRVLFMAAYGQQAAGRLAWLHATGAWPVHHIDHINGIVDDNRMANLRDVPNMENLHNQRRAKRQNKSGFLGVTTAKTGYAAEIQVAGKRTYLGWFKTPEAAHSAYLEAKRRLHSTCTI